MEVPRKQKTNIMNKPYLSDNNSDQQLNKTLENNPRVVHERQLLQRNKQNVMLDKKLSIEVHDEKKQNENKENEKEPLDDYEKVEKTQTSTKDPTYKCRFCEFESDEKKATTAHVQMVHEGKKQVIKKHDAIKPKMSYDDLIVEALNNSSNGMLEVSDIYNAISTKYPYYKLESKSWQNCIRHNLSLSNLFVKERKYWKLDKTKLKKNCRATIPALLSEKEREKEYKQNEIDVIPSNPFSEISKYEKIREKWTVSERKIFKNKMKEYLNPTKCPKKSCKCPKKSCYNNTLLDKHLGSKNRPTFDSEFLEGLEQKSVKNCVEFYYLSLPSYYNLEKKYCLCRGPSEKDMIGCNFCSNWFHRSCLKLTIEEFDKEQKIDPWKCPQCPCFSVRLRDFKNFINYYCVPCNEYFASKKLKKYHEETNHKEKNQDKNSACKLSNENREKTIFKCGICNKEFNERTLFQEHRMTVHENYDCSVCGKYFSDKEKQMKHFALKHRGLCNFCKESFPQAHKMQIHIASDHPGN